MHSLSQWRFHIGLPKTFYTRTVVDLTDFTFSSGWTDSTYNDIDGVPHAFKYTSSGNAVLPFTGSGVDLYVVRKDSAAPAFGWMSLKLSAASKNTYAALTNRNCNSAATVYTPDTFEIIDELPYANYDLKIASLLSSTNIGIYGGVVYGELTSTIQDTSNSFNAFTFDVNPNVWDEGVMGGTLENNMAGTPVLTKSQSVYREINISGQMIGGYTNFRMGDAQFISNMRTKFEFFAEMQTRLLLIDDLGIDHVHEVYIVPNTFSVERRRQEGSIVAYSYSMTLKEINRGHQ